MKKLTEQEEIKKVKYIYNVKEKLSNYLWSNKTAEEIKEEINQMCLDCFLPVNPDCEICNWHCKDQLFLNFEVLEVEEVKPIHKWDWDDD